MNYDGLSSAASCNRVLGDLYHGNGVQQSYYEAAHYWMKAVEQGNAKAQMALGNLYAKVSGFCRIMQGRIILVLKSGRTTRRHGKCGTGNTCVFR